VLGPQPPIAQEIELVAADPLPHAAHEFPVNALGDLLVGELAPIAVW
jgi:hypothetical protein